MVAWLIVAGKVLLGLFIGRILVGAGLALVTYQGVSGFADDLIAEFRAQIGGLPSDVVAILEIAGIGEGLSLLFGTMVAIFSISASGRIVGIKFAGS